MARWGRAVGRFALAAVVVLAALSGPQPRGGGCPSGDGRGPLTLATGKDLTRYLRGVLAGWNRDRPRERVRVAEVGTAADEVRQQMRESLRSGDRAYDVLNIDVAWTAEFAEEGWLAPLDPDGLPLDQLLHNVRRTAVHEDRLYAAPYVTNVGLLFYRKDFLKSAGADPPRTWAELARLAAKLARHYGVDGYAGQFLPYEGLTVNVLEAVLSAGGPVTGPDGRVTVDSPQALTALSFLRQGVQEGWISEEALGYREEESRQAFQAGKLVFLRNWPYVYTEAMSPGSPVAGRVGVAPLPGLNGPGTAVLGGSNMAVNACTRHPRSAADLLAYLLSADVQRQVLTAGGLPPVRASVYEDPALKRDYPHLTLVRKAVQGAQAPRSSPRYEQMTLVIAVLARDALAGKTSPRAALERMERELRRIAGE
ncbi:ABC transporter substrate-binding protein [Streptomyces sp. NPDC057638]|uniref:ABC transporter substrate-binding protein n=1 Tax=Streptomyces sp. NPDC057638 TaxID=3346190 RepID=UPI0036BB49DF